MRFKIGNNVEDEALSPKCGPVSMHGFALVSYTEKEKGQIDKNQEAKTSRRHIVFHLAFGSIY